MISWYKNRVCLNVLANSLVNAKEVYNAAEGFVLVGLLSSNYSSVQEAVESVKEYQGMCHQAISIGLGGGNPNQWKMVSDISTQVQPAHINQVFSAVSYTRAKNPDAFINALVSPTEEVGMVNISVGPLSKDLPKAIIPIETAIAMVKEMGGNSIKFFPMNGLKSLDSYQAVAKACADMDFGLEPTGGIDLENFEQILRIAIDAGVPKIIPHVYSSIIGPDKSTNIKDVSKLMEIIIRVLGS